MQQQLTVEREAGIVADLRGELGQLLIQADAKPAMAAMLDGSATREQYAAFLVQTRCYVENTMQRLEDAERTLTTLGAHGDLAEMLLQKAEEEAGHERLIDRDLEGLGIDAKRALSAGPGRWTSVYNAWSAAITTGPNPAAFLGSAYLLEGLAVERAGRVANGLRASKIANIGSALSFLDVHAGEDIEHVADLEAALAKMDDERELHMMAFTAAVTREAYIGLLDDVMAFSVARSY